ncbi:MAG: MTH938/NDUFAF3 family protein [Pseudomonadota bacterium]
MRFSLDTGGGNSIQSYSDQGVVISDRVYASSVLVTALQVETWTPGTIADLDESHLAPLLAHQPGIVILGTGARLVFPAPRLLAGIQQHGIGVEVMANAAAVRTFNVLLSEDRPVLLALLQG